MEADEMIPAMCPPYSYVCSRSSLPATYSWYELLGLWRNLVLTRKLNMDSVAAWNKTPTISIRPKPGLYKGVLPYSARVSKSVLVRYIRVRTVLYYRLYLRTVQNTHSGMMSEPMEDVQCCFPLATPKSSRSVNDVQTVTIKKSTSQRMKESSSLF